MFNMSFCVNQANGVNWNKAVVEGAFPETGQWCHLAFTFERVNEKAQGNIGYYVNIYCNGELQARKFFLYAEPICTDEAVFLGNGTVGDYGFCGDIASAAMFMRTLSEAEIAKMASSSPQVKALPEGQHEIGEPLKTALAEAVKNAKGDCAKWLLSCLERSAVTGYDQKIVADLCNNGALKQDLDLEKLAQEWNKAQDCFRLLVTDGHGLFMAQGKVRGISPVIGIYDAVGRREITGMRPFGWALRHGGRRVRNYDGDVTLDVGAPISQGGAYIFNAVWKKPGAFICTSRIRFSGARTEMDLQVENLDAGRLLGTVEFPQFSITKLPGKNDQLVFPLFSGVLYKSPTTALGISGNYPSARSAMQFIGYFDEQKNGIYAALEGTDGAFRTHSVNGRNGTLRYEWSNNVPYEAGAKGGNSWRSPGVAVLQSYRGDWFEAGQIYKDFLGKKADWFVKELPRKDTPKWYRDNTFWLAGSSNTNPQQLYLRDYFELPYAIWWCRWEKVSDDNSPILRALPENADNKMLRGRGISLQGYVNGRLWGFDEGKNDKIRKDESGAQSGGILQSNGKVYLERYGIPYVVMCPGSKEWQNVLVKIAEVANSVYLGGVYFDQ
ncbi:MAG: hypothetical protein IJS08_18535, partial [Victivallales bacterium]|nr:hypothetical protein [Victivallales bacterium]